MTIVTVVSGTYAVMHPAHGGLERCDACGELALTHHVVEGARHIFFGPVLPGGFKTITRCSHCQKVCTVAAPVNASPPRTLAWRIAASWALIVMMVATLVVGLTSTRRLTRAHAESPELGDLWTITATRWPDFGDEPLTYGRVKVTNVRDDVIWVAGCSFTSNNSTRVEERCHDFPVQMAPIRRAEIPAMVADARIDEIWRGDDLQVVFWVIAGVIAVVWFASGLATRRLALRSVDVDAKLPRARIRS